MRLHSTAQAQLALDRVTVDIPSKEKNGRIYLTWQPIKATARCKSSSGKETPVVLRNAKLGGGRVVLGATPRTTKNFQIKLKLPANGTPVEFYIGGETASSEDLDAVLQVAGDGVNITLATIPMMVRIRKDALTLTMKERFRFLRALAKMNFDSNSSYRTMRKIHDNGMRREAHANAAFLPWHRAYMLDFERELQTIDPSVALPYWRFDKPATVLFYKFFLGASPPAGKTYVIIDPRNPLFAWDTFEVGKHIARRSSGWDSLVEAAPVAKQPPLSDTGPATFDDFRRMERDPHDMAHARWDGFINDVPTAPRDPLFFMLHANVDRLWAVWQSMNRPARTDPDLSAAFATVLHTDNNERNPRVGHNLGDTMWPWNGVVGDGIETSTNPRPTFNVSHPEMCPSQVTPQVPPDAPTIRDMIDYQGIVTLKHLGFDYDDVKYPKDP